MSERITAANLDEVIKRNEVIEEQMKQSASLIWSKYNPMQINSPIQLALQILRPYGLIQLPIDNRYLSGAIFVRDSSPMACACSPVKSWSALSLGSWLIM